MFCNSTLLVYAIKVAGMVVHLGYLVLSLESCVAPAGGCRASNVQYIST